MDTGSFKAWLSALAGLSDAQIEEAGVALMAAREARSGVEVSCGPVALAADGELLARIGQARQARQGCPHCGGDEIGRWGKCRGKPRYRCASCSRTFTPLTGTPLTGTPLTFTPLTGTPLAGLHYPDRWGLQADALMAGETIAQAARRCGVHYTTAFRWRHRFLAALNQDKPARLSGIVEADETFILESFKGKRGGLKRAARKRGGKAAKRGLSAEQIPVMVARDRSGATVDAVLPALDARSIGRALGDVLAAPAQLCCDGGSAIKAFARRAGLTMHVLPAPGAPRPEAPELHINNVNAYHGRLKEWMRRFHGVATANLPNYLSWRRTIEAFGDTRTQGKWIMAAAGIGPYQRVTL